MKLEKLGFRDEGGFEDTLIGQEDGTFVKGKKPISISVRQPFMNDKEADWLLSHEKELKFSPYRQGLGRNGQGTHLAVIINSNRFIVSIKQMDEFNAKKAAEKKATAGKAKKKIDEPTTETVANKPKG